MGAARQELLGALGYLVAVGAILASSAASYAALLHAMPAALSPFMPAPETSGSGGRLDTRYVPWRLSPEEAQKRFETRSSVLLPPTPAFRQPEHGWVSQAAIAVAPPPRLEAIREPIRPALPTPVGAPAAQVDFQMAGR